MTQTPPPRRPFIQQGRPLDPHEAVRLRGEGMSIRNIALQLGVAHGRVRKVLADYNVLGFPRDADGRGQPSPGPRPPRKRPTMTPAGKLKRVRYLYYEKRWSEAAIAVELDMRPEELRRFLIDIPSPDRAE